MVTEEPSGRLRAYLDSHEKQVSVEVILEEAGFDEALKQRRALRALGDAARRADE